MGFLSLPTAQGHSPGGMVCPLAFPLWLKSLDPATALKPTSLQLSVVLRAPNPLPFLSSRLLPPSFSAHLVSRLAAAGSVCHSECGAQGGQHLLAPISTPSVSWLCPFCKGEWHSHGDMLSIYLLLKETNRSEEVTSDHPPRPSAQVGRARRMTWSFKLSRQRRNPHVFICTFPHVYQHG